MPKREIKPVNVDQLKICTDPIPQHRASPANKYEELFGKLKPGQAIKCSKDDTARVAQAMRKYIQQYKPNCYMRSMINYGDGMGRVWILEK